MHAFFRKVIFPLFIMTVCPLSVLLIWHINTAFQGSIQAFFQFTLHNGFFKTLWQIWQPVILGTTAAWKIILIFAATQLLLMRIIPGKRVTGPETPKSNIPVYKDNGFLCFLITIGLFYVLGCRLAIFSPTIVYDNFAGILGALNIFSLFFCVILYLKGRFKPSSSDHSVSGNIVFDYYWGTELYPRILGWDVKQFTNCRFGMMSWPVIILSFAAKQSQLTGLSNSMIAAVLIMMVYIAKFFYWESG